jgi:hypothetical protein
MSDDLNGKRQLVEPHRCLSVDCARSHENVARWDHSARPSPNSESPGVFALPSSRALSEDQIEALKIAIDTFGNGRSRVDHRVANRLGELLDRLTGATK